MGSVKRFKRIYVEITNVCNLNCSFCQPTLRPKRYMSVAEFQHICSEIAPYTNYIYLHVKGEPLLHPQLEDILQVAAAYNLTVNITTNGTLIEKRLDTLLANPPHQINLSFHSAKDNAVVDFDAYVTSLFASLERLHNETDCQLSLRLWTTRERPEMFGVNNVRILDRLHINIAEPFEWPDLAASYYEENGTCQGLKSHIAILCDGTVVPCCLDGNGVMKLGNIYKESLTDIINGPRATRIHTEFTRHRKACEELCRHCSYKERFKK